MRKLLRCLVLVIILIAGSIELWSEDGPYVFWKNETPVAVYIVNQQIIRDTLTANARGEYLLDWSKGQAKSVVLQKEFSQPVTSLAKPERFLALSDLHGNLAGTVELLLAAGVMDEHYNWIYDGWLIIVGDVFDRGEQTTECLWLLYHLWQQAEGKMITILGNHENMTIGQKTHEMKDKYGETCALLNMTYNELYGEDTLLGSWLRSWQTVLQLDDILFVHGGISVGFAQRFPVLSEVNELVWDYYHQVDIQSADLDYLFHRNGPFWYRGYFSPEDKWEPANPEIIDGIRQQYMVKNIVVGHTTFDKVQYAQDGRIIAIDAGLKYQESGSALLYESGRFFVLASDGTISDLTP
ncbi:MAG: metallophosphoesterase [Candidatus Cloacimonetes bacterium]|nr:metallophosphoesterase [Candidatus Cloacimonadota bacterium]